MRALVQRVSEAAVSIEGGQAKGIGQGFLVLLGVGSQDTKAEADKLWRKIANLRIFPDEEGKTNLNLAQVGGNVLVVSQFTLYANCRRGNRPSFIESASPDQGEELYEYFKTLVSLEYPDFVCGEFGASMAVSLTNQGPFTIWLDTDQL
ncbi:MAG: D-aminoacyl-tRNA deacylase [Eubacteriales bacterium]|nr:D-aminoacyl-tRNA deacylase [Eubacteriales bacterium]